MLDLQKNPKKKNPKKKNPKKKKKKKQTLKKKMMMMIKQAMELRKLANEDCPSSSIRFLDILPSLTIP